MVLERQLVRQHIPRYIGQIGRWHYLSPDGAGKRGSHGFMLQEEGLEGLNTRQKPPNAGLKSNGCNICNEMQCNCRGTRYEGNHPQGYLVVVREVA